MSSLTFGGWNKQAAKNEHKGERTRELCAGHCQVPRARRHYTASVIRTFLSMPSRFLEIFSIISHVTCPERPPLDIQSEVTRCRPHSQAVSSSLSSFLPLITAEIICFLVSGFVFLPSPGSFIVRDILSCLMKSPVPRRESGRGQMPYVDLGC